jgi:hypothetical protein
LSSALPGLLASATRMDATAALAAREVCSMGFLEGYGGMFGPGRIDR